MQKVSLLDSEFFFEYCCCQYCYCKRSDQYNNRCHLVKTSKNLQSVIANIEHMEMTLIRQYVSMMSCLMKCD
jgi:hypothetical protein